MMQRIKEKKVQTKAIMIRNLRNINSPENEELKNYLLKKGNKCSYTGYLMKNG
jgi:hypothetical protein